MNEPDNTARLSWAKFLNPEALRGNLIACSLYLVAWETLRSSIVDHVREFFSIGFDQNGEKIGKEYGEILARHKSPLRACLLWFRELGAIDDSDLGLVERLLNHRNEIAHELPKFIATVDRQVNVTLIGELCVLVAKIDRWWVRNVDAPLNPDDWEEIDLTDVPDSEIQSGNMLFLQMLFQIATGDEQEASYLYNRMSEEWPNARATAGASADAFDDCEPGA